MAAIILSSAIFLMAMGNVAGNDAYFSVWNNHNCTGDTPTTFPHNAGKIQENMKYVTAPTDLGVCAEVEAKASKHTTLTRKFSVMINCGANINVTQYYDSPNCSSSKLTSTYSFTAGNFTAFKQGSCAQATYTAASGGTTLPDKSAQLTGVPAGVLCMICGNTCPTTPPPAAANSTANSTNTTAKATTKAVAKGNSGAGSLHASFYVLVGLAMAVFSM